MNIGISKIIWGGAIALGVVVVLSGALLFFGRGESEIVNPSSPNGVNSHEGNGFPESGGRESAPYQYATPIPKNEGVEGENGSAAPAEQNTVTTQNKVPSSQSSGKLIFPQDYEPEAGNGEENYDPSQDSEEEGE